MASLESKASERLSLADYNKRAAGAAAGVRRRRQSRLGAPETDAAAHEGLFSFSILRAGNFCLALQPDRGSALEPQGAIS